MQTDLSKAPGPEGAISDDTACRKCAYNLRGLPTDGACPECSAPVELSLRGDLLRFADPEWVERLARGLTFLNAGLIVSIGVDAPGIVLSAFLPTTIHAMISLGGRLFWLYGAWLATTPDPAGVHENGEAVARRTARVGLILGLTTWFAAHANRHPGVLATAVTLVYYVGGALWIIGKFAVYCRLARVALRIPDPWLAKRARYVRWALAVPHAIVLIGSAAMVLMTVRGTWAPGPLSAGSASSVVLVAVLLALLCYFLFSLVALHLQWRMRRLLREQAALSRDTWPAGVGREGR